MHYIKRYFITFIVVISILISVGCSTNISKNKSITVEHAPTPSTAKPLSSSEKKQHQQIIIELSKNNLKKAKTLLKTLINKRPDLAGPQANLALIFYKENNIKQAQTAAKVALELNTELPETHNLLGMIEKKRGNFKAAEDHYSKAIAYKSDYSNAHYNLALLYDIYFQEVEKAVKHYRRYLELIDFKDQQTINWLEQLENSLKD